MKFLVAVLIAILTLTSSLYSQTTINSEQTISISVQTLESWQDSLNKATTLLQSSNPTIESLKQALAEAKQITLNLKNELTIAKDSQTSSAATIQQLQELLKTSQKVSDGLSAKVLVQEKLINDNKDITDNLKKDVSSLQNENFWLKIGLVGAAVITVGAIIYGVVK